MHNTPEFGTPLGNSYKCAKVQTFNLTEKDDNKTVAYLHISHVQMQAFANNTGHKFDTGKFSFLIIKLAYCKKKIKLSIKA